MSTIKRGVPLLPCVRHENDWDEHFLFDDTLTYWVTAAGLVASGLVASVIGPSLPPTLGWMTSAEHGWLTSLFVKSQEVASAPWWLGRLGRQRRESACRNKIGSAASTIVKRAEARSMGSARVTLDGLLAAAVPPASAVSILKRFWLTKRFTRRLLLYRTRLIYRYININIIK